jgi:hypothetical protein
MRISHLLDQRGGPEQADEGAGEDPEFKEA